MDTKNASHNKAFLQLLVMIALHLDRSIGLPFTNNLTEPSLTLLCAVEVVHFIRRVSSLDSFGFGLTSADWARLGLLTIDSAPYSLLPTRYGLHSLAIDLLIYLHAGPSSSPF